MSKECTIRACYVIQACFECSRKMHVITKFPRRRLNNDEQLPCGAFGVKVTHVDDKPVNGKMFYEQKEYWKCDKLSDYEYKVNAKAID